MLLKVHSEDERGWCGQRGALGSMVAMKVFVIRSS